MAHWRSVSVLAPLCVVAGSCATIAMLLEVRAESFLTAQHVRWLAVSADGSVRTSEGSDMLHEQPECAVERRVPPTPASPPAVGKPWPTR